MIVTLVSQCEKKALSRTRRVLDAFANRIGDNTWQTIITEEGLIAIKKLLRKTATKSTAVSCHWIRSRRRSELLWIVGNRNKFNEQGIVPVNRTKKSLQLWKSTHLWQNLEAVALASSIAGLFHDFGKANDLFQPKIDPDNKTKKSYEPFRHEWVSAKLFKTFALNKKNEEWLAELLHAENIDEQKLLQHLNNTAPNTNFYTHFQQLTPFAQLVTWLIISHHRLPIYPYFADSPPALFKVGMSLSEYWFNEVDAKWNSPNYIKHLWTTQEKEHNWTFSLGLPLRSKTWQNKAQELAKRALNQASQLNQLNWQQDPLTTHLSRLMLMLSDHLYSAQGSSGKWQANDYLAYANTDNNRQLKQKLDEHNIAVAYYAYLNSQKLPEFLSELPEVGVNRILARGFENADPELSAWQDRAFKLSKKINIRSNECGFFGINMASTGKGKTIANARIMYGLADEEKGCRFSIALGLRTLTTQTGTALAQNLQLDDSEIATLIGSAAIQRLLKANADDTGSQTKREQQQILADLEKSELALRGSESLDQGEEDFEIDYPDIEPDRLLGRWFKNQPKLQKLLHAPILVSTIDHLMPATESLRGGKQMAPMLRLLSADLILDEPDEFGLDDLPALSRLVNWAGMLGAKVLLSSATIPPAMAFALFESYCAGRQVYQRSMLGHTMTKPITCAWFDEFSSIDTDASKLEDYAKLHVQFIQNRISHLLNAQYIPCKAKIVDIKAGNNAIEQMSATLKQTLFEAHHNHHQCNAQNIAISLGVIRFANINPLVAVAMDLAKQNIPDDYCIHYCVYHSQFTLAQRSLIEEKLDRLLNRKQADKIWQQPEIIDSIAHNPQAKHHIFVVLATSVCEVGRDHDYDWAIAEPSSMRSLVQLAGRLQRHRKQHVEHENLFILNLNIKALQGRNVAFTRPGFEGDSSSNRQLQENKEIRNLLTPEQYQHINAIPCITAIKSANAPYQNLVQLEQDAYGMALLGIHNEKNNARIWWTNHLSWSGELQRQQPFRKSTADIAVIYSPNSQGHLKWFVRDEYDFHKLIEVNLIQNYGDLSFGKNSCMWFDSSEIQRYEDISGLLDSSLKQTYLNYGEVRIPDREKQQYFYHRFLGVFTEIKR